MHRGLKKDMKLFLQKERFHILFVYLIMLLLRNFFEFLINVIVNHYFFELHFIITCPIGYLD